MDFCVLVICHWMGLDCRHSLVEFHRFRTGSGAHCVSESWSEVPAGRPLTRLPSSRAWASPIKAAVGVKEVGFLQTSCRATVASAVNASAVTSRGSRWTRPLSSSDGVGAIASPSGCQRDSRWQSSNLIGRRRRTPFIWKDNSRPNYWNIRTIL